MKRAPGRSGFSLMEVLIVATILPIVAFAIFSNFSSGIRLWQTIGGEDANEETAIFGQRVARDLAQAYPTAATAFSGDKESFVLSTLVETTPELGSFSPGRAKFGYDAAGSAIVREAFDAHQIAREKPGVKTVLRRGVASFVVRYLIWEKDRKIYSWVDEIRAEDKKMPAAVKFEMEIESGGRTRPEVRIFYIPSGGA